MSAPTIEIDRFDYRALADIAFGEGDPKLRSKARSHIRTFHDADVITAVYILHHCLARLGGVPSPDAFPQDGLDVTQAADMLTSCHCNVLMGTEATDLQGLASAARLTLRVFSPSHYQQTLALLSTWPVAERARTMCVPFWYERRRSSPGGAHRDLYLAHFNPLAGDLPDVLDALCDCLADPEPPQVRQVEFGDHRLPPSEPEQVEPYDLVPSAERGYMHGQPDVRPLLLGSLPGASADRGQHATAGECFVTVSLPTPPAGTISPDVPSFEGPRDPLVVPLDDLSRVAARMDAVLAARGEVPHFEGVLSSCVLSGPDGRTRTSLVVDGVRHLVGQVGSGKSALAKVLAVWCAINGRRMTYVTLKAADAVLWAEEVDSICESLAGRVDDPLRHPLCAPIVGRSGRLSYADAICSKRGSEIMTDYEDFHLQTPCIVDAFAYGDGSAANVTSRPPCQGLCRRRPDGRSKEGPCPLIPWCPTAAAMLAELEAPVRCTTIEAFAQTKLLDTRAFELSLSSDDVVVFDECDAQVQRADGLANVTLDLDRVKKASSGWMAELISRPAMSVGGDREAQLKKETLEELNRHSRAICAVLINSPFVKPLLLAMSSGLPGDPEAPVAWDPEARKVPADADFKFFPLNLIEELYKVHVHHRDSGHVVRLVPDEVCRQLGDLALRMGEPDPTLAYCLRVVGAANDPGEFSQALEDWLGSIPLADATDALSYFRAIGWFECVRDILSFVLLAIGLTNDVARLGDNFSIFDEATQRAIGDFSPRRVAITRYLPAPADGSQYQFEFVRDGKDVSPHLKLHKERFFGPALVDNLHACVLAPAGDGTLPCGPNVLLLSGTSYLPYRLAGAVMRPVDYLLARDDPARAEYLRGTRFAVDRACGEDTRVSGTRRGLDPREDLHLRAVRTVARNVLDTLVRRSSDASRPLRKSLACLTSYADCRAFAVELATLASNRGLPLRVDYLSRSPQDCHGGDSAEAGTAHARSPQSIEDFGRDRVDVLVAPYATVARGYNIVLPDGHSALSDLFLCSRPLPVPEDLDELAARVSGYAELVALCPPDDEGDAFDAEERFRARVHRALCTFAGPTGGYATMRSIAMSRMHSPGDPAWPYPESAECLGARHFLDVVAGLLSVMTQVWGRSARFARTEEARPSPIVWFEDFAFVDAKGGLSTLGDIDLYLSRVAGGSDWIGTALYGDVFDAWRSSVNEGLIPLPYNPSF